jgi:RNA polymerase sigma-70 factor (ECF subfamily)
MSSPGTIRTEAPRLILRSIAEIEPHPAYRASNYLRTLARPMASRAQRGHLRLVEQTDAERVDRDGVLEERSPSRPDPDEVEHIAPAEAPGGELIEAEPAAVLKRPARSGLRGPLATLPDAQLVALGAKGEAGAFELLYRRHVAFALHLATRIEGSSRDVEDIVHDAFIKAFERINDLTDRGAFKSWLGAIVVHAVRSRMRRHRLMNLLGIGRKSEPVDLDSLTSSDASPHVRAQIAQIYALLRTLPADDRISWTLRCVEGHDLDSVAKLTRCSLATVKRRISRAQHFLDEHFIDSMKEELS